ncbi:hypothetical protein HRG_005767 [Hirsutella rhossiliensis]|uniref:Uncharacterized protein n=1 Tax=Hirsutella rhossiliensis TaxID=111463 RepID=A0A9P8MXQ3_9HYPO|nr:uncharacterized protein HRG_05767 [Hirsutella rhossiliensis]KAH0963257.1 hypothetical protein HRG_05767 [Hirsutella rhossiliensis]
MKFVAAATVALAGVAQAGVANQAINQDLAANMNGAAGMDGMTLLTGIYGGHGHGKIGFGGKIDFGSILKKGACALPCVEKAATKIPCKGKNLVDSACSSIDEIKKRSESCIRKCDVNRSIVDLVTKGAHFLCSKRQGGRGGEKHGKHEKPEYKEKEEKKEPEYKKKEE